MVAQTQPTISFLGPTLEGRTYYLLFSVQYLQISLELFHALLGDVPCLAATKVDLLGHWHELDIGIDTLQGLVKAVEFAISVWSGERNREKKRGLEREEGLERE